jgi:Zn-dependent protease with chaperone function
MNAFATGRNPEHSIICVTKGLLEKLDYYELEAVVAHELSHVKNYDILLASIISVMVGFVVILSDIFMRSFLFGRGKKSSSNSNDSGNVIQIVLIILGLVLLVLSPIISNLIQLAVSRKREYLADATAVGFTRNPQGLISALQKLDTDTAKMETASKSNDHMYIVSPFKEKKRKQNSIFSTHPSIEDRVKAISELQ